MALYELVRKIHGEAKTISALFDPDGNRIVGDERLNVALHALAEDESVWWYEIEPFENFEFIRIPVNASAVIESLGAPEDSTNCNAEYFRYIPLPKSLCVIKNEESWY